MSVPGPLPDDGALDEAAAEWLCERAEGFAPERARAFEAWCAEDSRHAAAVRRVERTLEILDEMPALRMQLEARLVSLPKAVPRPGRRMTAPWWLGGLAAALVLGLGVWSWNAGRTAEPAVHYVTDTKVQRSIALADGSVMDVNVGSDVAVTFTAGERRITLHRGEAHFQVAPNAARPFIVTAGDVAVRAVGTAFEVRLTSAAVDVVVVEGKVTLARSAAPAVQAEPPLLVAGRRAQVALSAPDTPPKIEDVAPEAIRSLLTWQTPMTSFTDVPLRDVITRFNRRNPTQLILDDPELGGRKIGGKIALDQVEAFVRLLEQDGDIVADRSEAGRIALRRAR